MPGAVDSEPPGVRPPLGRGSAEEVRVAIALNGGVSLAVWMGGCAVELDAARRAHLGPETLVRHAGDVVDPPPRTLYHALCRAFHRELVIDLMSGSSAGGINGALLAAAITTQRRLDPAYVREKWIALGDLDTLMHGLREIGPTSLMDGDTFRAQLEETFTELLPRESGEASRYEAALQIPPEQRENGGEGLAHLPCDVKLDVTATDVEGQVHRFADEWGEELIAHEYRQRFRFRRPADFTVERLTAAARASASFPLAFQPTRVEGRHLGLDGERWLIDGGLLDNAPIRSVLALIPARPSSRRVRRYVCYVNADPPLSLALSAAAEARARRAGRDHGKPAPVGRPTGPQLQDVLGHMVNLPRKATFVDHLDAIQRAAGRAVTIEHGTQSLLTLDTDTLKKTASAILPAYRSRRRLLLLEELFHGHRADARRAHEAVAQVGGEGELPWVPTSLDPPVADGTWGWGVRAAQRVQHLVLDLIRHAAEYREETQDAPALARLNAARDAIYAELETLDAVLEEIGDDEENARHLRALADQSQPTEMALGCLACRMRHSSRDGRIHTAVRVTAQHAFAVGGLLGEACAGEDRAVSVHEALFGSGDEPFGSARFHCFLERTLTMEVLRRAFATDDQIDTDQALAFAQITPCAPALLLTPRPIAGSDAPATPQEKLTGVGWGHFAAFYRRAWRANDFMWGRLDGAARVVDMLVDAERAAHLERTEGHSAAQVLAAEIWPADVEDEAATAARKRLVAEALAENAVVPPEERYRVADYRMHLCDELRATPAAALHAQLLVAIDADLKRAVEPGAPPPLLTRALCVRAAQLEILQHELPRVVRASEEDQEHGTSTPPLTAPDGGWDSVRWDDELLALRDAKRPLPQRLGAGDEAEMGSTLMVRTVTRGALVGLAAIRETGLPLRGALFLPGALLLPPAGMVARQRAWSFVSAVAFWVLTLFVAGRMLAVDASGARSGFFAVIATYVALVGIVMICAVPAWRALRSRSVGQGVWALVLLAVGFVAAGAVAASDTSLRDVLALRGSPDPPLWLVGVALASLGFVRRLWPPLRRLALFELRASWRGPVSLWRLVPWAALAVWAAWGGPLWDDLTGQRGLPRGAAVGLMLVPLLVAVSYAWRRRATTASSPAPGASVAATSGPVGEPRRARHRRRRDERREYLRQAAPEDQVGRFARPHPLRRMARTLRRGRDTPDA